MTRDDVETGLWPERPRVLLVGDSIACGLGTYGESFGTLASARLGASDVLDLTGISVSVGETLDHAGAIRAFAPQLAILGCGTTESLVHPGPVVKAAIERLAPPSWHGQAGLEPRPYFSGGARRRLGQRISAALKAIVKRTVIRLTGGGRRIELEAFRLHLEQLVALLEEFDCPMIFIGLSPVDESLFPGTNRALSETQTVLEQTLAARAHVELIDPRHRLRYWDDFLRDRLHLAQSGNERLAGGVVEAAGRLVAGLEPQAETSVTGYSG